MKASVDRPRLVWLVAGGAGLMLLGYGISCVNRFTEPSRVSIGPQWLTEEAPEPAGGLVEPPFVPPSQPINMWSMSQRSGSVSYQTFAAGLSCAVFAIFVWLCDVHACRAAILTTLGSNALAAYIIHDLVAAAVKPYAPRDAPLWFALAAFAVFFCICWLFIRHLERNRIFLRL